MCSNAYQRAVPSPSVKSPLRLGVPDPAVLNAAEHYVELCSPPSHSSPEDALDASEVVQVCGLQQVDEAVTDLEVAVEEVPQLVLWQLQYA